MPPAAVTHQPGPGRAPAPPHLPLPCIPPHPTRCPGDGLPASSSPRRGMGPARLRQQPSPLLNNRVLSWRGPPSPAWAEHSCPRPPAPAPRHGRFLRVPAWHPPPPSSTRRPPRARGDVVPRPSLVPGPGAKAGAASPRAGVGAGGAAIQEAHRKLLEAAPEINGRRRIPQRFLRRPVPPPPARFPRGGEAGPGEGEPAELPLPSPQSARAPT